MCVSEQDDVWKSIPFCFILAINITACCVAHRSDNSIWNSVWDRPCVAIVSEACSDVSHTTIVWTFKHILSFTCQAFITQVINKTKPAHPEGHWERERKKCGTASVTKCSLEVKSNVGFSWRQPLIDQLFTYFLCRLRQRRRESNKYCIKCAHMHICVENHQKCPWCSTRAV